MKKSVFPRIWTTVFSSAVLVLGAMEISHAATVTADGFKLRLNGSYFVAKGMNYSPVPIGVTPGDAPFGDYFVKHYDNVWKPDLDKMRAANINVIKLYAGDPALNAGAAGSCGNWKQFLDYCWNKGKNPIYVVMMSYTQGGVIKAGGAAYKKYITDYTSMVKSTVKHPAIFGYLVGNEITGGVDTSAAFWTNYGALVDAAHAAGLSQGVNPFLSTAIVDNYTTAAKWPSIINGENSGHLGNLDAWMINIYRGPGMGGTGNSPFAQYKSVMGNLGKIKPMLVGEWGTPHTTRPASVYGTSSTTPIRNLDNVLSTQMGKGKPYFDAIPVSQFLKGCWDSMKGNIGAGASQVCVGGFVFGWCDEYWKANNKSTQVGGPNASFQQGAFAGGYEDEAGFGVSSAVNNSRYGRAVPIVRDFFKGYTAVKQIYSQTGQNGAALYNGAP